VRLSERGGNGGAIAVRLPLVASFVDYEAELDGLLAFAREQLSEAELAPLRWAVLAYRKEGTPLAQAVPGLMPRGQQEGDRIIELLERAVGDLSPADVGRLERQVEAGLPCE
jgi:hypothetical protein